MDWTILLMILVIVFVVSLVVGIPVAFAMAASGLITMVIFFPPGVVSQVVLIVYRTGTNFALLTIPLFILMAGILSGTGLTSDLYDAMKDWFGHLPGGLGIASIAACTVFGAVCGSTAATTAAIGLIAIPEMRKAGYNGTFATAIIACGGTLGTIIPPSNTGIVYGVITETSIGKIFMANIIPGLLLALMLMVFIWIISYLKPSLAPSSIVVGWRERFSALKRIGPIVLLIILILGSIYGGVCTPSEAAALGCVGALVIAILRKRINFFSIKTVVFDVVSNTAAVMMLLIGTYILGHVLIYGDIASNLTSSILSISSNKWIVISAVYVLFVILGMFIEPLAVICLVVPLIFPVLVKIGFDPIWIGVMCVLTSMIGNVSPPVGITMYIAHGFARDLPLEKLMIQVIPFIAIMLLHLIIITIFPSLVMWLPDHMLQPIN